MNTCLVTLILVCQVGHRHGFGRVLLRDIYDTTTVVASLTHATALGTNLSSHVLIFERALNIHINFIQKEIQITYVFCLLRVLVILTIDTT